MNTKNFEINSIRFMEYATNNNIVYLNNVCVKLPYYATLFMVSIVWSYKDKKYRSKMPVLISDNIDGEYCDRTYYKKMKEYYIEEIYENSNTYKNFMKFKEAVWNNIIEMHGIINESCGEYIARAMGCIE